MKDSDDRLSVRILRTLVTGLRMGGRDADAVLHRSGIDPAVIDDATAWVPLRAVLDCWKFAAEDVPDLGLRFAEGIDFSLLVNVDGITDYLFAQLLVTSRDVAEGLDHLERYSPVTFGPLRFVVERDSTGALVRFAGREARSLPKEFVNFGLTFPMRALLQTASRRVSPAAVFLPYATPTSIQTHERVFGGAPLHFRAATAGYRIGARDLAVPLIGANPDTARRLRLRADDVLQDLSRLSSFTAEIRSFIRAGLRKDNAGAPVVARRAGTSVRVLARRLKEQGTNYRALVDEVRAERARELLRETQRPLIEVAEAVGFTDKGSFLRAFRRWQGTTPGQFRENCRKEASTRN
jgi:AraC-like DNA-binding protein